MKEDRSFYLLIAGVILALVAVYPLARLADRRFAREGPMYHDIRIVQQLEYRHHRQTGEGLAFTADDGTVVAIAGRDYTPSDGVTVEVTVDDGGYCIEAANQHGDVAERVCRPYDEDPGEP